MLFLVDLPRSLSDVPDVPLPLSLSLSLQESLEWLLILTAGLSLLIVDAWFALPPFKADC